MGNWYITLQYRIETTLDWFSLCRRLLAGCSFFHDEAVDHRSDLQYALDDLRIPPRLPQCSSHFLHYCTYTIHILLFRRLLSLHTCCCCLPWCEVQIFKGTHHLSNKFKVHEMSAVRVIVIHRVNSGQIVHLCHLQGNKNIDN